jgi:hypothetical protein
MEMEMGGGLAGRRAGVNEDGGRGRGTEGGWQVPDVSEFRWTRRRSSWGGGWGWIG